MIFIVSFFAFNFTNLFKDKKSSNIKHMNTQLDIVQLIEKNPITRFNQDYQNKFVEKVKGKFTDSQQQLFLGSFYCYLNYDSKTDFVIDLDNVWKWLGFGRKSDAKRVVDKHFNEDIDYKITKAATEVGVAGQQRNLGGAGFNKETIKMTINTFKKLCLKSNTKKADEIHDYFIKLEETFQEIVNEESEELKKQMMVLEKENSKLKKKKLDKFLKKEAFYIGSDRPDRCVIGISVDVQFREQAYVLHNPDLQIRQVYYCRDYKLIESVIKKIMAKYIYHDRSTEWFGCSPETVQKVAEVIIHLIDNEYTTLDDLKTTFENLHDCLHINQENIQATAVNVYFGETVYKKFIDEKCEINENNKESAKNILLAFKDFVEETSKFEYFNKATDSNNSYGFVQTFQKEFYRNIKKLLNVELTEFRMNGATISGFKTLKIKEKNDLNTTQIKNDFPQDIYEDFILNWIKHIKKEDKRGQLKIKTSDIVIHFIKYLETKSISYKNTLSNDNKFRIKLVKQICNKFDTKEHARLSFNGDVNRNRNKGFYGIELLHTVPGSM